MAAANDSRQVPASHKPSMVLSADMLQWAADEGLSQMEERAEGDDGSCGWMEVRSEGSGDGESPRLPSPCVMVEMDLVLKDWTVREAWRRAGTEETSDAGADDAESGS